MTSQASLYLPTTTSTNSSATNLPYSEEEKTISQLPEELILSFFAYLGVQDTMRASAVCRQWNAIAKDNSLRQGFTTGSENLGALPYIQNKIPCMVLKKADEINQLKERFKRMATPVVFPKKYRDPVMLNIMEIPIFDSFHVMVESAHEDLFKGIQDGKVQMAFDTYREGWHILDKDSFEACVISSDTPGPLTCLTCSCLVSREHLKIDVKLQNEILQFLREAVAPAPALHEQMSLGSKGVQLFRNALDSCINYLLH